MNKQPAFKLSRAEFEAGFSQRQPDQAFAILQTKTVGIAGLGGLGSNVALALCRAGIGHLILVDHDQVELSNLNRQQYNLTDLGKSKTQALSAHLLQINPFLQLTTHNILLKPDNIGQIFPDANLLIEALDEASTKQMFIETALLVFPDKTVIAASGLAGFGNFDQIKISRQGRLIVCGDQQTDAKQTGLLAPRVALVANLQADCALEVLLT